MTALIAVMSILAIVLALQLGLPLMRARRRSRLRLLGLRPEWRALLDAQAPLYRRVPAPLKPKLEALIGVFVAEKEFVGCAGVHVTEQMKLAIATQACLLILNRTEDVYDHLSTILVYPAAFLVPERAIDDAGVVTEERRELIGQASDTGHIILSWADVELASSDNANVVLHEFAHYLDFEDGAGNGAPVLAAARDYARWSEVMRSAYARMWHRVRGGRDTVIDEYALEDEAEFFAVATETFFEQSAALRTEDPLLYAELSRFYQLDPADWPA
ncbi:MAG TPA: M90 family metallopeptidase [Casimicrobiaceae bacterium]|nr:M90 family metallopeptidase [Casimicrobiaceae bacterium]